MATKTMSKNYGYNCTVCGDPIKEPQPTEHTDTGLAHAKCCRPKRRKTKRQNVKSSEPI